MPTGTPATKGIGNQIFKPKLVKRLYLKYWSNTNSTERVCSICWEPFTHRDGCVAEKGLTVDVESVERAEPTDETVTTSAPHVHNNITVVEPAPPTAPPDDISNKPTAATDTNTSQSSLSITSDVISTKYDVISECSNRVLHLYSSDTCVTSCGHCFHYQCLLESLKRRTTCPECRQSIDLSDCCALYRPETNIEGAEEPRLVYSCRPLSAGSNSPNVNNA